MPAERQAWKPVVFGAKSALEERLEQRGGVKGKVGGFEGARKGARRVQTKLRPEGNAGKQSPKT